MWPDEQKTSLIIENTDQETVRVTLWREQKSLCRTFGKYLTTVVLDKMKLISFIFLLIQFQWNVFQNRNWKEILVMGLESWQSRFQGKVSG